MTTFADLSTLPPVPDHRFADPALLHGELLGIIAAAADNHPRSRQQAIGPSEVGNPCDRAITHKLVGTPTVDRGDRWRPTVGTAVHAWLHDTFVAHNAMYDHPRWLCEFAVNAGSILEEALNGSCDLYDRWTATSVDWKVVGPTTLRHARAGPAVQYRQQGHLYGRGWTRRGLPVDTVAICYLPANGSLRESVWWSEPYDEEQAVTAIARVERLQTLARMFPDKAVTVAATAEPEYGCPSCPYYLPAATELTEACPGHTPPADRRGHSIIANEGVTA